MNLVILVGRMARDPELRYTPNGSAYCLFTLACDRARKNEDAQEADFIQCVCWGKTAENTAKYMAKGRACAVNGRLAVESYEKDGERRWRTNVVCQQVEFLGGAGTAKESEKAPESFGTEVDFVDEDLPF